MGLVLALAVGLIAVYGITPWVGGLSDGMLKTLMLPMKDALISAMVMGLLIRFLVGVNPKLMPGIILAPALFIPIGVIFYGANTLNFVKFATVPTSYMLLELVIVLVYFGVIIWLGKMLNLRDAITYLVATGSGICGASAIAITSPVVEAEPDDVSCSLIPITLVAMIALWGIVPFIVGATNMATDTYAIYAGSTLQFTGFVKAAVDKSVYGPSIYALGTAVKGFRYIGLLIAIPLFASLIKGKAHVPWFIWAFLVAGLVCSYTPMGHNADGSTKYLYDALTHAGPEGKTNYLKPVYAILWSTAMAAIGLNADLRSIFSEKGGKAVLIAFIGFLSVTVVFLVGMNMITA